MSSYSSYVHRNGASSSHDSRVAYKMRESIDRCAGKRFFKIMTAAAFPADRSNMTRISRIHPSSSSSETTTRPLLLPHRGGGGGDHSPAGRASSSSPPAAAALQQRYTVWKRSSMGFQGTDGFSVYDTAGALAFRLDNYSRRSKIFAGDLLLMDGQGAPLLALRPQIFSMHDQWNCYKASEEEGQQGKRTRSSHPPLFSMRKCSILQHGHEAEAFMSSGCSTTASDNNPGQQGPSYFSVEGCFRRRNCKIRNSDGEEVARITRKKAGAGAASNPLLLGDDVFSLVVEPNVDATVIMAFVVVLDRICWRPYAPMICSSS